MAAADPDSPEVQYPGIYKPNKKPDAGKVCSHEQSPMKCDARILMLLFVLHTGEQLTAVAAVHSQER